MLVYSHVNHTGGVEDRTMDFLGLERVQDVEKESQYGYVYGVSGPGKWSNNFPALILQYV